MIYVFMYTYVAYAYTCVQTPRLRVWLRGFSVPVEREEEVVEDSRRRGSWVECDLRDVTLFLRLLEQEVSSGRR